MKNTAGSRNPRIKSYVIRASRMSDSQRRAYQTHAPRLVIPPDTPLDWAARFPHTSRRVLEIGFGMGDATRRTAQAHPDWALAAVEVHRPGIGKLLWWIEKCRITNILIIEGDAVDVLQKTIPPRSLDALHIWFPDPWPKKRHRKRRLITPPFAALLPPLLRPGGIVHAATDWEPYAEQILDVFNHTQGLKNRFARWAPKPDYRPNTKFENRGIAASRPIRDIIFEASL